jgi:hypothetical protein
MTRLTDQERQRFADWLEMEADSNEGLAAQMDKIAGPMMGEVSKRQRIEAAAMRLIAKRLRSTESMSIGQGS